MNGKAARFLRIVAGDDRRDYKEYKRIWTRASKKQKRQFIALVYSSVKLSQKNGEKKTNENNTP